MIGKRRKEIKDEIKTEYLNSDTTPWIIGYSGGKDSTTVLQLVIEVLIVLSNEGIKYSKNERFHSTQ